MAKSMNTSSAVWSVCLIVSAVVSPGVGNLLHAQRAALQAPETAPTSRPKERIVFKLKHATAHDALETISRIFDSASVRLVDVPRLNSLIVAAPREELEEIQKMIEILDREPPVAEKQVRIFNLSNIEPDNALASALHLIDDANVSFDRGRGAVIAAGSESTLNAIEALLAQLDRQPDRRTDTSPEKVNEYQVRLVWLVAGLKGEGVQSVPADLENVTRELAKIGITDLRMAAQLMINTLVGHDFTTTGTAQLGQPCIFELSGSIEFRQAPSSFAGASNEYTGTASRTSQHPQLQLNVLATKQNAKAILCQLKTTIKAPIGHSVVLGVTPLDSMTSVFVVQLRPKSGLSND